jgi:Uma2 family endonuclease
MIAVEPAQRPTASPQLWPLTVEAYHVLGEAGLIPKNTELLYGQVYQKMSKSPFHSGLVLRLLRLLQAVLPPGWLIRPEQPLTCGGSEPEPDLAVVRGREQDFWREHPRTAELVIEVCVSSRDYDRSKVRAYAQAGVKEVWIVLGPEEQVEVYRQPSGDTFAERQIQGPGGRLLSTTMPGLELDLEALFRA